MVEDSPEIKEGREFVMPRDDSPENDGTTETEKFGEYPYSGIVIFGHGAREDEPEKISQEARIRMLAAFQLWKDGVAPRIIVTGGLPENDWKAYGSHVKPSGELMKEYLMELGVPEEAMVFEYKSTKTVDNMAHALNELQAQGLPTDDFVTVSTGYHMERITDIMRKFGLKSAPVGAELGLLSRAKETADRMKEVDIQNGLPADRVEANYQKRLHWYDDVMEALKLTSPNLQGELRDESKWQEAMKQWGYWGPLALAIRGPKLREIVEKNQEDIEAWLERHPDMGVTLGDLLEGNFDYMELVAKGREVPA